MKQWIVLTPSFTYTEVILDDGSGPTYETCDTIEVDAITRRDAISEGVKRMLADYKNFDYVHAQRSDGLSPYTGVKAQPAGCEDDCGMWDGFGTERCTKCGWTLAEVKRYFPDADEPCELHELIINGYFVPVRPASYETEEQFKARQAKALERVKA